MNNIDYIKVINIIMILICKEVLKLANEKNNKNNKYKRKKTKQNNKNNCNNKSKKKCDEGIGLSSFSYADYILLSSVIAYSIAEELNEDDLAMFTIFLELILTDLGLIVAKRGIEAKNNAEEGVILEDSTIEESEIIDEDILF